MEALARGAGEGGGELLFTCRDRDPHASFLTNKSKAGGHLCLGLIGKMCNVVTGKHVDYIFG